MTAHAFVLPAPEITDAEEWDELAKLTGSLSQPTSDEQLDAVASDALRIMAESDVEITRYRKALGAEMERIYNRYALLTSPHEKRHAEAQALVEECAIRAQFVGKAKSRKVGNGSYGKRQIPEHVKIMDDDKAINFLLANRPSAVMHVSKYKIIGADAKAAVLEHLHATGEVPEGFEHTEAHDRPFASPLPLEAF
jgi:Bacteriophage Mu Gam like protein